MTWLRMTCLTCTAFLVLSGAVVQAQEKRATGKGIDAATVAAYEKLGAEYGGWVKEDAFFSFKPGRKRAEDGLPGFRIYGPLPITGTLPEVAVPFGLDLGRKDCTDANLK